jgi:hypothetical protein
VRGGPSFKTDSYNITHTGMEKVKISSQDVNQELQEKRIADIDRTRSGRNIIHSKQEEKKRIQARRLTFNT